MRQVETVRDVLEQNHLSCWMAPRDIAAGMDYYSAIPTAIKSSRVFLLFVSQNALESKYVIKELRLAVENGCIIIPFMLENIPLNDEFDFLLSGSQRYEAYLKKSEALENLIIRIRTITNPDMPDTQKFQQTEPTAPPTQPVSLGNEVCCPACGSNQVHIYSDNPGKFTLSEYLFLFFPPLLALLGGFVTMFISALFISIFKNSEFFFYVIILLALIAAVLCWIRGVKWTHIWIRRSRIRRHVSEYPYRCTKCDKKFLIKEK